jgi:hypothetical protein
VHNYKQEDENKSCILMKKNNRGTKIIESWKDQATNMQDK